MENQFFEKPILNSPYDYPAKHWELVEGQPTQKIVENRRRADFITPIPKPRKRKKVKKTEEQVEIVFDEGKGISTAQQQYDQRKTRLASLQETTGKEKKEAAAEIDSLTNFLERATNAPKGKIFVVINGVDVFHPNSGEVRSDNADGIACWFIDTDYNEESFFVRHAYFLGANDPYKSLKRSLKAEINEEAWETLNSDTSRPFRKPSSGRIAVKVINHLGDEVMKVFKV